VKLASQSRKVRALPNWLLERHSHHVQLRLPVGYFASLEHREINLTLSLQFTTYMYFAEDMPSSLPSITRTIRRNACGCYVHKAM